MSERPVLFQAAVLLLLLVLAILGILIVIQNNDTQVKLEELRAALQAQRNTADITRGSGSGLQAAPVRPGAEELPDAPSGPALALVRGPDGVEEYSLSGLRVRAQPYRNPDAVAGDVLTRSFSADPQGLNPYIYNEALGSALFAMCTDVLAARDFDDPERWNPALATRWSVEQTIRVYLKPGAVPMVPGTIAQVLQEKLQQLPGAAKAWADADIVSMEAGTRGGRDCLVLKTNSIRDRYAAYLDEHLHGQTEPVHYVTVALEPQFKLPAEAGEPLKLDALIRQAESWQGAWNLLPTRVIHPDFKCSFVVLGDAKALAAKLDETLLAASPHFVKDDRTTRRGAVEPIEPQTCEILPSVTFWLRKGVHWQTIADPRPEKNGATIPGPEFTAADIVFTHDKILRNPQVPCEPLRNYFEDLGGVTALDAYTVRFDWSRPYFQAFENSAGFTILPGHIFSGEDLSNLPTSKFGRVVCGTGPWQFKRWTPGVEFTLERNADYWGVKPHLARYTIKFVKEPPVVLSLFQEGKLDLATLTPDQWKNNADSADMQKIARRENGIANSYYYVGYNQRKPPFDDVRVRRALTMLIDSPAIIHSIFNDNAAPLTGPFHPLSPDNNAALPPMPCDPAGALKLLKEAGWQDTDGDGVLDKDGKPFEFDLMFRSARPEHEQIASFIQQANRKAGIRTNLVVLEWSAFLERVVRKQDFTACILGWQLGYSQDPFQLWHSSQTELTQSNFTGYRDARSDELIVQARYTLDPTARRALYHELHQRIYDAQPYTFLFVPKRMNVYSRRFEDVKYTLLDTDLNRWWVRAENQRVAP